MDGDENNPIVPPSDSLLIAPVTALTFIDTLLLAGEGPTLKLYVTSRSSNTLLRSISLFKASNVHGITAGPRTGVNSYLVAVHGGKSCCIVELDTINASVNILERHEFPDWILATAWLRSEDGNHLTLATAHNCVLRWDWKKQTVLERVHCQEKCILYSALLIGDCWRHLVLAGGTVFNQVVIWDVCGDQDQHGRRQVLHRLAGHQGVIFSMTFNPAAKLLCSVSDDRSIRVWRVDTGQSPSGQDTGHLEWASAQFTLVHVLYGHTARVWDARYLGESLVSIGEDSTCCIWNAEGQVIKRLKGHRGKSIWSLAVNKDAQLIATGGGDAGIRLWELTDHGMDDSPLHLSQLNPPPHLVGEGMKIAPKVTRLMNKDTVLIMTDAGALFQYQAAACEWSLLMSDVTYQSYGLLTVSPGGTKVAVGNLGGHVKLLADGEVSETHCHDGKVFSLVWLAEDRFITTGPEGKMILWLVNSDLTLEHQATFSLPPAKQRWAAAAVLLTDHELLVCGDRVGSVHLYDLSQQNSTDPVQSFWKVHGKAGVTDVRYHDNHVYSAGRDGEYREYDVIERRLELLHSNKVLKGLEWIAQIRFTEDDMHVLGFYTDQLIVHSVATNQTLLALPCGGGHRAWDFTLEETGHVTFVYIKAGAVEMCRALLRSSRLLIKPSLHGREVTDVKLISTHANTNGTFSVIATSSEDTRINLVGLRHSHGSSPEYCILATLQGHISSVRALATSPLHKAMPSSSTNTTDPRHTQKLTAHKPMGQCKSVIIFSGGGRAQLKAWRISTRISDTERTLEKCDLSSNCQVKESSSTENSFEPQSFPLDVQYEHLATFNLHEKGRRNRKPWRKMTFDPSPETRYMALSAIPLSEVRPDGDRNIHILSAACSDGFIRLLGFREDTRSFSVIGQSDFHNHCVLTTRLLTVKASSGQSPQLYMFSAGTDGRVSVWEVTSLVHSYIDCFTDHCPHRAGEGAASTEPCLTDLTTDLLTPDLVVDAHQSGVNAMDVYCVKDGEYLMATGGDDNCLTVHRLSFSGQGVKPSVSVTGSSQNPTAHAAQINGVYIEDATTVKSVSIDQRLVTWDLTPDLQLTQASCKFTHVSDVSQMESWRSGGSSHAVVTGMGMEYVIS